MRINKIAILLVALLASWPARAGVIHDGDVNGDGLVNISDISALIHQVLNAGNPEVISTDIVTEVINVGGVKFQMVFVEPGTFIMGAADDDIDAADRERPAHEVTLTGFYMGATEVTQQLWVSIMGNNPSDFNDNPQRPVDFVSWDECQQFITLLNQKTGKNFRLPTEAEWEYAAKGGNRSKGYRYAGSNDIDEVAWYEVNSYDVGMESPDFGSHAVGTLKPNELGLFDMSGNVMEWCQDNYGPYSGAPQTDPTGPVNGNYKVTRGGSWGGGAPYCRVTYRGSGTAPSSKGHYRGFRLVMPLP